MLLLYKHWWGDRLQSEPSSQKADLYMHLHCIIMSDLPHISGYEVSGDVCFRI